MAKCEISDSRNYLAALGYRDYYQNWDAIFLINKTDGELINSWYFVLGNNVRTTNYAGSIMMPSDTVMALVFNNDFLYGSYIILFNPMLASPITPIAAKLIRGTNFFGGGCFVTFIANL